ncbi:hypothetical protein ACFWYW_49985 [Nonomuraea sp. NPDC059023]
MLRAQILAALREHNRWRARVLRVALVVEVFALVLMAASAAVVLSSLL